MEQIKFTVGKTSTGFDAYYEHNDRVVAVTTGDTIGELKANAIEAYNIYASEAGFNEVTAENIFLDMKDI